MNVDEIPPRFEHKFLVPQYVADEFRERMRDHAALDVNSASSTDHRYLITSLYYDTPTLDLFEDTQNGARKRFKLRVRRYGEKLGDSPVFFEVKHRIGDIIKKTRAFVPPLRWAQRLADDHPDAKPAEIDFRSRVLTCRCEPTLLVRYAREAWKGHIDNYVRVTFDTRLEFAPVDARRPVGRDAVLESAAVWEAADDAVAFDDTESLVLIEVKFEQTVPRWLASTIQDLGMTRQGFSKYAVGVARAFGREGGIDVARRIARY
ncbi:MAG: polyphosphate polymerase domain-containing protein [Deltaproteobacteria bacterium]|nr:polyphosphate polymerase domain-containing protein [Deltaproteobacteria bacterium]